MKERLAVLVAVLVMMLVLVGLAYSLPVTTASPPPPLPPLPDSVWSVYGPIKVNRDSVKGEPLTIGMFMYLTRTLTIHPKLDPATAWATLYHELCHIAVYDGGQSDVLKADQEEKVCDAVAMYQTGALVAKSAGRKW